MKRSSAAMAVLALLALANPAGASAEKLPPSWDGLIQVPAREMSLVYVQPGADFRGYTKVMIQPTEVAFHKDWRKDYNSTRRDLAGKVSETEVQRAVSKGIAAATDIFTSAWQKGGYEIASAPAPDVLLVRTGVLNISVTSPDRQTSTRSYGFANEAGRATLVVEVRDSMTGALLGRAVDRELAGDNDIAWRTSGTNRADFRDLVAQWAKFSVDGVAQLKAMSPIAQ